MRRIHASKGISLVELLTSFAILSFFILPALTFFTQNYKATHLIRQKQKVFFEASRKLQQIKLFSFEDLENEMKMKNSIKITDSLRNLPLENFIVNQNHFQYQVELLKKNTTFELNEVLDNGQTLSHIKKKNYIQIILKVFQKSSAIPILQLYDVKVEI